MARVLLQPRGSSRDRGPENFVHSVVRGLRLDAFERHLTVADAEVLRELGEPVRLWGSTPTDATRSQKARALAERRPGDEVFFCAERSVVATARIAHVFDNAPLARAVWGSEANGQTWQHLIALADVVHYHVPSEHLAGPLAVLDSVRGLTLLPQADSDRVLAAWAALGPEPVEPDTATAEPFDTGSIADATRLLRDLVGRRLLTVTRRSNTVLAVDGPHVRVATERSPHGELVPIEAVQHGLDLLAKDGAVLVHPSVLGYRSAFVGAVLADLPGTEVARNPARVVRTGAVVSDAEAAEDDFAGLDGKTEAKYRREQAKLRALLLDGATVGSCALCGDEFPAALLVAAHVKRRSLCDDAERRDLRNVAMLACVFGCDALFEKGYVGVDGQGVVIASPAAETLGGTARERVAALAGRPCGAYTPRSATYYGWHVLNIFSG